jgi:glutamate 5-kinase
MTASAERLGITAPPTKLMMKAALLTHGDTSLAERYTFIMSQHQDVVLVLVTIDDPTQWNRYLSCLGEVNALASVRGRRGSRAPFTAAGDYSC